MLLLKYLIIINNNSNNNNKKIMKTRRRNNKNETMRGKNKERWIVAPSCHLDDVYRWSSMPSIPGVAHQIGQAARGKNSDAQSVDCNFLRGSQRLAVTLGELAKFLCSSNVYIYIYNVYIYIHIYVYMYIHTCICLYTHLRIPIYIYIFEIHKPKKCRRPVASKPGVAPAPRSPRRFQQGLLADLHLEEIDAAPLELQDLL